MSVWKRESIGGIAGGNHVNAPVASRLQRCLRPLNAPPRRGGGLNGDSMRGRSAREKGKLVKDDWIERVTC